MNLVVNGRPHIYKGKGTLAELIEEIGADPLRVAVVLNGDVVRRSQWDSARLSEGDEVEVLTFAAGG